ncbi:hypothetical protein NTH35_001897 [Vibrio fluvialis]|nr:hypothetical protein [Vibrio fluvialis]EKO3446996.1 hypothetical protein [Vibrio fluvialis]ELG2962764.1 hypothetical protein [Vibrio fluvialis]
MTKFASILAATVLSTTFAAGAMASDLQMNVMTRDNLATVSLTQDGQALANYPVEIQGQKYVTAQDGTVTIKNNDNSSRTVKFVAADAAGNSIVKTGFVSRDNG